MERNRREVLCGVIERQQALVDEINEREAPDGRTALELQALWIVDGDAPCLVARQHISGGSATGLVPISTDMRAPARCDRER